MNRTSTSVSSQQFPLGDEERQLELEKLMVESGAERFYERMDQAMEEGHSSLEGASSLKKAIRRYCDTWDEALNAYRDNTLESLSHGGSTVAP